jgi:AraC-like DNA-binding protein
LLAEFDQDAQTAQELYQAFVERGMWSCEKPAVQAGIYLASQSFLRERVGNRRPVEEVPRPHWQPLRLSLAELFASELDPIRVAYREYGYTLRDLAEHLGCHYSTVSRRLRRSEQVLQCKT